MKPSTGGFSRRASGRGGGIFRRRSSKNGGDCSIDNNGVHDDDEMMSVSSSSPISPIPTTMSDVPRTGIGSFRRRSSSKSSTAAKKASAKVMSDCEIFLSSNKLGNLLSDLPHGSSEWLSILKRSLNLWQSLDKVVVSVSNDRQDGHGDNIYYSCEDIVSQNSLQDVEQTMWETTCRLVKGSFYVQEKLDLSRLHGEEWHDYALHAAVGLTSLRPVLLNGMIERLVQCHPMELQKIDPQTGRLPLHVVTATKYRAERMPILDTLVALYPKAAGIPTANVASQGNNNSAGERNNGSVVGIYPLHLACKAGYPWKGACQDLYNAAPHIGAEMQQHCPKCPAQLLRIQSKASLILEQYRSWETAEDDSVAAPQRTNALSPTLSSLSSASSTSSSLPSYYHDSGDNGSECTETSSLRSFNLHSRSTLGDTATIKSGDDMHDDLLFLS